MFVCCFTARRATFCPYRLGLGGPFRRAKNGPSQMRSPGSTPSNRTVSHSALENTVNVGDGKFLASSAVERAWSKPKSPTLSSAFPHFTVSSVLRDFGVTQDQELTLAPHIHLLCLNCYYQILGPFLARPPYTSLL